MASGLAGNRVPEPPEGAGKIVPAEIAGQPHAGMTSSRTKWMRMSFGRSASS
jgi:hypothetical protein